MAKPTVAELGLNPLAWCLLAIQLITVAAAFIIAVACHLSIGGWSGEAMVGSHIAICGVAWLYFVAVPGRSGTGECRLAETLFVFGLMLSFTLITAIAQYPAVAVGLPYADRWLARADAAFGINVADLARWTSAHPTVSRALLASYTSFSLQFVLTIPALAAFGDRRHLWELAFHYHLCLLVAIASLALFPAICPQAFYGFRPTADMTLLIGQIRGFHDGTLLRIPVDHLQGLVSVPSFHTAGALMVTWAWRRRPLIFAPVAVLNLCLVAATFLTGIHYLIDTVAGVVLFASSVLVYRRWPPRLLPSMPSL